MKKIIILFLVLCGAGLGTSCDDFLTEHPSTQFSPEDVYSSPNGVQAVLNSCYGYISQSNGYGGYLHMLLSWHTPTMQLQNRNSTYMVELATMNVAVDNSTADYVYDGAYQTINTVNDLLMNIGLCSGMSKPNTTGSRAKRGCCGRSPTSTSCASSARCRISTGPPPPSRRATSPARRSTGFTV